MNREILDVRKEIDRLKADLAKTTGTKGRERFSR
jgi:uncharacterized small protein (DUF1192 family)